MTDLDAIRARDAATYDMPLHFGAEVIAALDEALDDRRALLAEVDRLQALVGNSWWASADVKERARIRSAVEGLGEQHTHAMNLVSGFATETDSAEEVGFDKAIAAVLAAIDGETT